MLSDCCWRGDSSKQLLNACRLVLREAERGRVVMGCLALRGFPDVCSQVLVNELAWPGLKRTAMVLPQWPEHLQHKLKKMATIMSIGMRAITIRMTLKDVIMNIVSIEKASCHSAVGWPQAQRVRADPRGSGSSYLSRS